MTDKKPNMGRPRRTPEDRQQMLILGQRLFRVRRAMGLSQEAMASLIGIHATAWSKYELGTRMPDTFALQRIMNKLNLSRSYLEENSLDDLDQRLAVRIAALYPEVVPPIGKVPRKGEGRV